MGLIDGADFIVRLVDLPNQVRGSTVIDTEGMYNIYINQNMPYHIQIATFQHEVGHIMRDDFFNRTDIRVVEA